MELRENLRSWTLLRRGGVIQPSGHSLFTILFLELSAVAHRLRMSSRLYRFEKRSPKGQFESQVDAPNAGYGTGAGQGASVLVQDGFACQTGGDTISPAAHRSRMSKKDEQPK